jgi:DNA-directed RNA polymerase specialized sigma24 family protein
MASSNREAVHRAIDDLSDDEAEVFYKVFTERRKHEEPGLALRAAFVEVYRARREAAASAGEAQEAGGATPAGE